MYPAVLQGSLLHHLKSHAHEFELTDILCDVSDKSRRKCDYQHTHFLASCGRFREVPDVPCGEQTRQWQRPGGHVDSECSL
jgi:hypothetical protein